MNSSLQDRTQVYRIPIRPQYKRRKRQKKHNHFPGFLVLIILVGFAIFRHIDNQVKVRGFRIELNEINKTFKQEEYLLPKD